MTISWFMQNHSNTERYNHYSDVRLSAMASQIPSFTIVYSTVYSGADHRKHQSSASLAFVRRIHRSPVNSAHKGPVTRKMFPFEDVIMAGQHKIPQNIPCPKLCSQSINPFQSLHKIWWYDCRFCAVLQYNSKRYRQSKFCTIPNYGGLIILLRSLCLFLCVLRFGA